MTKHDYLAPFDKVPALEGRWLVRDAKQRIVAECHAPYAADAVLDALRREDLFGEAMRRRWEVGFLDRAQELPDGGWAVKCGGTYIGWGQTMDDALTMAVERSK